MLTCVPRQLLIILRSLCSKHFVVLFTSVLISVITELVVVVVYVNDKGWKFGVGSFIKLINVIGLV